MTLTAYRKPELTTPFRRVTTLGLDQLFDHVFGADSVGCAAWLPAVDIHEDKDNVTIVAELPGLKKDEIKISLQDGLLTLTGERQEEKKHESSQTWRSERWVGRFQRAIDIPGAVNADKIKATYKDGVLSVVLPKAEEAKTIPIEVQA